MLNFRGYLQAAIVFSIFLLTLVRGGAPEKWCASTLLAAIILARLQEVLTAGVAGTWSVGGFATDEIAYFLIDLLTFAALGAVALQAKQDVSAMDGWRAAHSSTYTRSRANNGRDFSARLRNPQSVDLLPGDPASGGRSGSPHAAGFGVGDVSRLAARLAPFAGDDAFAIADQLIARYGSTARALSASRESLGQTLAPRQDLADTIAAARELADYGALEVLQGGPLDTANPDFIEFLRRALGHVIDERLLGIFLDGSDGLIAAEWLAFGLTGEVEVAFRPLIKRALDLGARGLVLAHNHPSGDARPSSTDRRTTRRLQGLLQALDCNLCDHLIVGGRGCYSMARASEL